MNELEFAEWLKTQSKDVQLNVARRYTKGHAEGLAKGLEGCEKETKLNTILKPLCVIALPAGVFLQYLFNIIR